jgi:hypothetical protein
MPGARELGRKIESGRRGLDAGLVRLYPVLKPADVFDASCHLESKAGTANLAHYDGPAIPSVRPDNVLRMARVPMPNTSSPPASTQAQFSHSTSGPGGRYVMNPRRRRNHFPSFLSISVKWRLPSSLLTLPPSLLRSVKPFQQGFRRPDCASLQPRRTTPTSPALRPCARVSRNCHNTHKYACPSAV